jgi:hypothetical protein
VVYRGGLENRWGESSRGFESLPLRHGFGSAPRSRRRAITPRAVSRAASAASTFSFASTLTSCAEHVFLEELPNVGFAPGYFGRMGARECVP